MALADDSVDSVAGLSKNHPSNWHSAQPGSEIVMVSAGLFISALDPLLRAHQAQGQSSVVVPIDDLYDEFNFGERTPQAIRDFLQTAVKAWHTAPAISLVKRPSLP